MSSFAVDGKRLEWRWGRLGEGAILMCCPGNTSTITRLPRNWMWVQNLSFTVWVGVGLLLPPLLRWIVTASPSSVVTAASDWGGERPRNEWEVITTSPPLYSGKLSREKTFVNFEVLCGYSQKFSPRNLGAWHLLVKVFSRKFFFLLKRFSPTKVFHYTYLLLFCPQFMVAA